MFIKTKLKIALKTIPVIEVVKEILVYLLENNIAEETSLKEKKGMLRHTILEYVMECSKIFFSILGKIMPSIVGENKKNKADITMDTKTEKTIKTLKEFSFSLKESSLL